MQIVQDTLRTFLRTFRGGPVKKSPVSWWGELLMLSKAGPACPMYTHAEKRRGCSAAASDVCWVNTVDRINIFGLIWESWHFIGEPHHFSATHFTSCSGRVFLSSPIRHVYTAPDVVKILSSDYIRMAQSYNLLFFQVFFLNMKQLETLNVTMRAHRVKFL